MVESPRDEIAIRLSKDEALVFFDLLSRYADEGKIVVVDQAEQRVLWDIHSMLECQLAAPLAQDYESMLARARAKVRDEENE